MQLSAQTLAWLDCGTIRYFVRASVSEFVVESAVLKLINGVYDTCRLESLRVLRNRIFTNFEPSDIERSVVKVAAKRIQLSHHAFNNSPPDLQFDLSQIPMVQIGSERATDILGSVLSDAEAIDLCRFISRNIELSPHRYESPRPVCAILIGPDRRLMAAAVNTNEVNRLRHAEINLISNFYGQFRSRIPHGCTVVVSMSPCRMCAPILASMSEDGPGLRVIALQRDLGRYGSSQLLTNQVILA